MLLLFFPHLADEEKVGPWLRGPFFLSGKETLQSLRIHKVIKCNDRSLDPDSCVYPVFPIAEPD